MTVGLFFPLPGGLAKKFPSLGEEDDSPPHVTFLYVGDGPEPGDIPRFLDVVRAEVQNWPWRITGTLMGLEYFHNPEHTVAYDRVSFFNDMTPLRVSMLQALETNGFTVEDSHPLDYHPHATLAYLSPGDTYAGDVPQGSWTFNTVEVWGLGDDPVEIPMGNMAQRVAMAVRVAARYKSKKKIKTKDGGETTVYEYSDRQVANRHREKAERVEHLRKHMSDLRSRVKSDLKSDDPQTRMTALAVSLMDHTCERVGNDESAEEGHFGVTGWLVDHVTFKGDKATIKYVGKSGVDHEKTVDDGPTVTALKELTKGRKGKDAVFNTEDARVTSEDVNDYLAEFDITAKDIRGFRANDEMCKALREERSKGPKTLPKGRKEKDEILKAEFKRALETVAEVVGHEASTLRSQYLVPGLEDQFVKDGTVLKSLKVGTKTHGEREDEAVESLVKPSPKKKPPRHDLRRERLDLDDPDTDTSDDDLSLNYKDAAVRVAMAVRIAHRVFMAAQKDEDEFQKWVEGKQFTHPKTHNEVEFGSLPLDEQKRVRKKWTKKVRKDPDEDEIPVEHDEPEEEIPVEHGDLPEASQVMRESVTREIGSAGSPLPKSTASSLDKVLQDAMEGQDEAFTKGLADAYKAQAKSIMDRAAEDMANDDPVDTTVPKGMYSVGGDDEDENEEDSPGEFDPKKSAKHISSVTAARDKLSDTVAQATGKLKSLQESLKNAPAEKANGIKTSIREVEGTLNKASASLKSHNDALTRMVAYHAGMSHLMAHLSDPTRLSRGTYSGPTDDDSTTSDDKLRATAVYEYQSLPEHVVKERRARAESRLKEIEAELKSLPPSQVPREGDGHPYREPHTSDAAEKLRKEKDALENDILAARFVEITRGGSKGESDKTSELIRRFKSKGINDPHLQHLLKHGMSGEAGQKAVHNLLQGMDDDELGKFVGDEGADLHEMLSELDPRKPWAGAARRDLRKDIINRMLFSEGSFDGDDGEKGITQMVGNARDVGQTMVKNNVPEKKVRRWWNGLRDILKKDKRVDLPEATSKYSLKDMFQKLNPKNFWKGRPAKTSGSSEGTQPSRVATRYLAYSKLVR